MEQDTETASPEKEELGDVQSMEQENGQPNESAENATENGEATSPAIPTTPTARKRKTSRDAALALSPDLSKSGKRQRKANTLLNGFDLNDKKRTSHVEVAAPAPAPTPAPATPTAANHATLKKEIVVSPQEAQQLRAKLPKGYTYEPIVASEGTRKVGSPLPAKRERKPAVAIKDYVSPKDGPSSGPVSPKVEKIKVGRKPGKKAETNGKHKKHPFEDDMDDDNTYEFLDDDDDVPSGRKSGRKAPPKKRRTAYDKFDSEDDFSDDGAPLKRSKATPKKKMPTRVVIPKRTATPRATAAPLVATPPPPPVVEEPEEPEEEPVEPENHAPEISDPEDGATLVETQQMLACHKLLLGFMKHKYAPPFNQPVDPVKLGIPDYLTVIKRPMDFSTIQDKIDNGEYSKPEEFCVDMRLVFANAMLYNAPGSQIYNHAERLSRDFERKYAQTGFRLPPVSLSQPPPPLPALPIANIPNALEPVENSAYTKAQMTNEISELRESMKAVREEIIRMRQQTPGTPRAPRPAPFKNQNPREPKTRPKHHGPSSYMREDAREMTFEEKRNLSQQIGSLGPENIGRVVQIINDRNPDMAQNGEEIVIDIDALDAGTLRYLEKYVKSCVRTTQRKKVGSTKLEQAEIAAQNTSRSIQDVKKKLKELNDMTAGKKRGKKEEDTEDLVIDDEEEGPKEYPSVVIEKDRSGSSSSSSDSSSSSSTDSESSGSEAERKRKEKEAAAAAAASSSAAPNADSSAGDKPEQDNKDASLPTSTSPKREENSNSENSTSKDSASAPTSSEIAPNSSETNSFEPPKENSKENSSSPSTLPPSVPQILPVSQAAVNKEVALKNLDSWTDLSRLGAAPEKSATPARDDTWSKFQSRDLQNKQREKEREEQEEKERKEKLEREMERRRQEEMRLKEEREIEAKKKMAEEEAALAFQKEIAQKRAAEKAAREQESSRNRLDESVLMSSFEQSRSEKPAILGMFRLKDDDSSVPKEDGEL